MPAAILFDLDDTIITHDVEADECWRIVCAEFKSRMPVIEAGRLFTVISETRDWYWDDHERHRWGRLNLIAARRELVALAFDRLRITDSQLAEQIADAYSAKRDCDYALTPGSIDTLRYFQSQGIKLALVSNGGAEAQRQKVQQFGLAPFFNHILIEGEFGSGKPDERVFRHTLRELGVTSEEAWMVGDDLERDIGGAQGVGIFSIWIDLMDNGLPQKTLVKPDYIIRTLPELLTMM